METEPEKYFKYPPKELQAGIQYGVTPRKNILNKIGDYKPSENSRLLLLLLSLSLGIHS